MAEQWVKVERVFAEQREFRRRWGTEGSPTELSSSKQVTVKAIEHLNFEDLG